MLYLWPTLGRDLGSRDTGVNWLTSAPLRTRTIWQKMVKSIWKNIWPRSLLSLTDCPRYLIFCLPLPLTYLWSGGIWMGSLQPGQPEAFLKSLTVPLKTAELGTVTFHTVCVRRVSCELGWDLLLRSHSRWGGLFRREADSDIRVTCTDMWPSKTPMGPGFGINQTGSAQSLLDSPDSSHTALIMHSLRFKYISLPLLLTHAYLPLEGNKDIIWEF